METAVIKIEKLVKRYESVEALKGIDLEVFHGEIFGLIGPDGAGKTSLMRILTTLLLPDEGNAQVGGYDVVSDFKQIRSSIGYMPGRFSLYQDLTVVENLRLFATIFGTSIEENYELIKDIYVQIEPFKHRRAGQLSGGMKQKLALSCALIHKPEVLILDEPTTGVDPVSRKEFWGMLKKLKAKGITILVSTPYMDEAGLCDRIGLIQDGRMLSVATPKAVVDNFDKPLFSIRAKDKYKLIKDLEVYDFSSSVFLFGEDVHYTDKRHEFNYDEIQNYLEGLQNVDVQIKQTSATVEDCFMALMLKNKS